MTYTAWSVILGEVPTESKWNQLGENDASFVDGTGIDDNAIGARHVNQDTMWRELGRHTLASPARYLDVLFTPAKVLRVLCSLAVTTTGTWQNVFYFNNNVGANSYTYRFSDDYDSDTTDGNSSGFGVGGLGNNIGQRICRMDIINERYQEKLVYLETTYPLAGESGVGYAPHINQQSCKWTDANDQISRIGCYAGLPSFDAGSEMVVLGHD